MLLVRLYMGHGPNLYCLFLTSRTPSSLRVLMNSSFSNSIKFKGSNERQDRKWISKYHLVIQILTWLIEYIGFMRVRKFKSLVWQNKSNIKVPSSPNALYILLLPFFSLTMDRLFDHKFLHILIFFHSMQTNRYSSCCFWDTLVYALIIVLSTYYYTSKWALEELRLRAKRNPNPTESLMSGAIFDFFTPERTSFVI